jgi:hypothetical protein
MDGFTRQRGNIGKHSHSTLNSGKQAVHISGFQQQFLYQPYLPAMARTLATSGCG